MSETQSHYNQEANPESVMRAIEFYTFRGPISPAEGQDLMATFEQQGPDAARQEMSAKLKVYCDAEDAKNGTVQIKN